MQSNSHIEQLQIVTLLGRKSAAYPWSLPCMRSWTRITKRADAIHVISDGSLDHDFRSLLPGINVTGDPAEQEILVAERISRYPSLRKMRARSFWWRKILDASLFLPEHARQVVYIDTDVFVRNPVTLAASFEHNITYMREDVPAYLGSWIAPLVEPMVLSFNSGLVAYQPECINLEFLEHVTSRYLLHYADYPWSEQMAWGLIAGRTPNRRFWCGEDARVVSGYGIRTADEMSRNVVKYISRRTQLKTNEELLQYAGAASIVHLTGRAKHFFEALLPGFDSAPCRRVDSVDDPVLQAPHTLFLAARLLAKRIYESSKR